MIKRLILIILIFLFMGCSTDNSISSGTEIGNGYLSAVVVNTNGEPILNAKVTLLTTKEIPKTIDTLRTVSFGSFNFVSEVDTIINILIQKDTLSLFLSNLKLSAKPTSIDTFIIKPSGSFSVVVEDSSMYADETFFISGTGISENSSSLVKDGEHWLLTFENIPEMDRGQIVLFMNDSVENFSGSFSVTSGYSEIILGGISWKECALPANPLISIAGWKNRLWWGSDTTIFEIENGAIANTYMSDSIFTFENLTATTIGVDGTFWLANNSGYIGYITTTGYNRMIPTPSCTSSIISMTPGWSIDMGNGIAQNDTAEGKYFFTNVKFTKVIAGLDSSVWATTDEGEIYHIYDSSNAIILTTLEGLPGDSILDIASTSNGDLWVVTESTVLKISNSNVVETPTFQGESLTNVKFVEVNSKGVWFASNSTLYILLGNTIYPINWEGISFNGSELIKIHSHIEGSFWLVSDSGLFEF